MYGQCCLYEITVLRYFMRCAGGDAVLLSVDGGESVQDLSLFQDEADPAQTTAFWKGVV